MPASYLQPARRVHATNRTSIAIHALCCAMLSGCYLVQEPPAADEAAEPDSPAVRLRRAGLDCVDSCGVVLSTVQVVVSINAPVDTVGEVALLALSIEEVIELPETHEPLLVTDDLETDDYDGATNARFELYDEGSCPGGFAPDGGESRSGLAVRAVVEVFGERWDLEGDGDVGTGWNEC